MAYKPSATLKKAAKTYNKSLSPPFQEFHVHCGPFDYGINFIISKDLNKCADYVNQKFEMTRFSEDDFNCLGKVFFHHGHCPIMWLPQYPTTPQEQGTLAH